MASINKLTIYFGAQWHFVDHGGAFLNDAQYGTREHWSGFRPVEAWFLKGPHYFWHYTISMFLLAFLALFWSRFKIENVLWENLHVYVVRHPGSVAGSTMPVFSTRLWIKPGSLFCLNSPSFRLFMPSQENRSRDSFILTGVSTNAWPITLLISMAAVKRLTYVTWSAIYSRLSQLHPFPLVLAPFHLPMGSATKILMMSLTSYPSVGNYKICHHDHDASCTLFWDNCSSPVIMSWFWGEMLSLWGSMSVCVRFGGFATLCRKKRPPHNKDRHVDSKHKHSKTNGPRLPL